METKHELAGSERTLEAGQRLRAAASPTLAPLLTDREKKRRKVKRKKNKQQQHLAITSVLDKCTHPGKEMEEPREGM